MNKILLILFSIILISCEEIIEIDLNSSDPKIIIEANLTNSVKHNFIYITESTDYYNPDPYKTLSGAEIFLKDEGGETITFEEVSPGKYQNKELNIQQQSQYNIEVNLMGQKYTSTSFAPEIIEIDSLGYKLESRPFNKDKQFLELHVYFQDNPDRLTNGNMIDFFFFNFDNDEEFNSGDIIEVELHSIDEQTYLYFNTLRKALARSSGGPFGSTAPANPINNWSNDALGYFSTFTYSSDSIILE